MDFSEQKEKYDKRDYCDCNVRLKLTIDIEASPELKNILLSERAEEFVAQCYLGVENPTLNAFSESQVLRGFSVEQIEDSEYEKYDGS